MNSLIDAVLSHVPLSIFDPVKTRREGDEREAWKLWKLRENDTCLILTHGGWRPQGNQGWS